MRMNRLGWMGILLSLGLVSGCDQAATPSAAQEEILVYCGITMVHPIKELARQFEPQLGMKIVVTQDDSGGLYDSLKHSRQGDVYFPGSESFIRQGREEGLLEEGVLIGENPVAFIVAKGNPKRIQPDLKALLRTDVRVVLASESSAIGRLNRRLLEAAGVWEDVLARNVYFATESRNLMQALKQGDADVVLNFRAVGFFPEHMDQVDVVSLPGQKPARLVMSRTTVSRHPAAAAQFIEYVASDTGQAVFRRYGFIDRHGRDMP